MLEIDHFRLMWHVAITSDLDKDDPKKFKMGTPQEVSDAMDRSTGRGRSFRRRSGSSETYCAFLSHCSASRMSRAQWL
jgi:hypothetical protein